MKMKPVLTLLALAAAILNLPAANPALPAPLPEFLDPAQTAKWAADKDAAAAKDAAARASEPTTQFYTGKPYVADAGGYMFKYRTYNPELSRWTSADPSGFPDGANNGAYAPVATSQVDTNGLHKVTLTQGSSGTKNGFREAGTPILNEKGVNETATLFATDNSFSIQVDSWATSFIIYSPFPTINYEGTSKGGFFTANSDGTISSSFPDGKTFSATEGNAQAALSITDSISSDGMSDTVDISFGGANVDSSSVGISGGGVTVTGSTGGAAYADSFELVYTSE